MISLDQSGRPFIIIRDQERKKRLIGDEARKANILAANTIGDVLKSSLGPKGMDKMLIDQDGEVTVSNDGATIMSGMPLEDPVAKLLVELSNSQDDEIGDGTTSVVVLASELLRQALTLLEKGVHPVKIADGFQRAVKIAISHLNTISDRIDFSVENLVPLIEAAETSLGSKIVNQYKKEMAYVAVKAVLEVADLERKDVRFDLIKLETKTGGEIKDTRLVNGIIIDKGFSHPQMTKSVSNPKIAILTTPFEPPKLKTGHKIDIDSVEKYKKLETLEQDFFKEMVDKVVKSGANVVFCQWGFDDEANHLLYQNGIHAVRWVGGVDIELLAISTGANIVPRFDDLDSSKLGKASVVKEVVLDTTGESLLFVEGCEKAKTVTILVRGGNKMVIEESRDLSTTPSVSQETSLGTTGLSTEEVLLSFHAQSRYWRSQKRLMMSTSSSSRRLLRLWRQYQAHWPKTAAWNPSGQSQRSSPGRSQKRTQDSELTAWEPQTTT